MNYRDLVAVYEAMERTSKRLEKTWHIANLLKKCREEDLDSLILLLQGRAFPIWDASKIGVASKLVVKALNVATGTPAARIEDAWKKTGDLGLVAEQLVTKKSQSTLAREELTTIKVITNLQRLAKIEGPGSVDRKTKLIAELLGSARPLEARYLIRTLLEELRVGVASGTLRDAIAWAYLMDPNYDSKTAAIDPEDREAYSKAVKAVEGGYQRSNDYAVVARAARAGLKALGAIPLKVGTPIQVMLAQKQVDIESGFASVGTPAHLQYKYDGFRMQVHKEGPAITLFTRRLEEVTAQFPEVVACIKKAVTGANFILDGEAVGYDPKTFKYQPFQHISQRIRRKYDIPELAQKLPVELVLFDVLHYNGKTLLAETYKERFALLGRVVKPIPHRITLAATLLAKNPEEAEAFYKESLAAGNEGIIMKNLTHPYQPGSRVGHWVKIKPVLDTLDLVVVGAEWGEGKRGGWLTSFTLACQSESGLVAIGRVGTGVKELESEGLTFAALTELLKPDILSEKGREVTVRPTLILEVAFEEIQMSPTYKSGFALRFPRVIQVRDDRGVNDISTLDEIKDIYARQRGRNAQTE